MNAIYPLFYHCSLATTQQQLEDRLGNAYREDPLNTLKAIAYIRDKRFGLGLRKLGRQCYQWLASNHPETFKSNIRAFIENGGRWDDMTHINAPDVETSILEVYAQQLRQDLDNIRQDQPPSKCAKWIPTESKRNKQFTRALARQTGLTNREFRQSLTALKSAINDYSYTNRVDKQTNRDNTQVENQCNRCLLVSTNFTTLSTFELAQTIFSEICPTSVSFENMILDATTDSFIPYTCDSYHQLTPMKCIDLNNIYKTVIDACISRQLSQDQIPSLVVVLSDLPIQLISTLQVSDIYQSFPHLSREYVLPRVVVWNPAGPPIVNNYDTDPTVFYVSGDSANIRAMLAAGIPPTSVNLMYHILNNSIYSDITMPSQDIDREEWSLLDENE